MKNNCLFCLLTILRTVVMVKVPTPMKTFKHDESTNEVPGDLKKKLNGYMNGMTAKP